MLYAWKAKPMKWLFMSLTSLSFSRQIKSNESCLSLGIHKVADRGRGGDQFNHLLSIYFEILIEESECFLFSLINCLIVSFESFNEGAEALSGSVISIRHVGSDPVVVSICRVFLLFFGFLSAFN